MIYIKYKSDNKLCLLENVIYIVKFGQSVKHSQIVNDVNLLVLKIFETSFFLT